MRLIVIAGKAGTGKTTLGRRLSSELRIPYFDYDTLVQPFLREIEKRDVPKIGKYAFYREWREVSYETLFSVVRENLGLGIDVLVTAPFSVECKDRLFPESVIGTFPGLKTLLVYMAPQEGTHYEMMSGRGSERDSEFIADRELFTQLCSVDLPVWDESKTLILDSGNKEVNFLLALSRIKAM